MGMLALEAWQALSRYGFKDHRVAAWFSLWSAHAVFIGPWATHRVLAFVGIQAPAEQAKFAT